MDLDTMLAEAAPARRASLDGPDSPAAAELYQRLTAAPPAATWAARRTGSLAVALLTAAVAGLAVAAALVLIPGAPHTSRGARAQLAAWSVARRPGGLVLVTIQELRDPVGLSRMLRQDGVPANVRFLPNDFTPTSGAIPRGCRAARLSEALAEKIMPDPNPVSGGHTQFVWIYGKKVKESSGLVKIPSAVILIRP
ncbi:MAG: hypothetical protein J2P29_13170, partial [Actinobacteria bacterium]|nr:hypothetical protein [Actinomycetota bacterium]